MNLLAPGALLLAALAGPIVVLWMLKLRRREVQVSSTLLWQMLLADRQANAPWQRLRRNLLLFLQLLILAALVLGLARPALLVPSMASGPVVIVLDGSASMNALDGDSSGETTRFAAAQSAAAGLVASLPEAAPVSVILALRQPQTLVSAERNRAELRRAIAAAQPASEEADWEAALALAAGTATAGVRGEDQAAPAIVVISDGGLPSQGLPPLPVEVRFLPVGSRAENLAVSALAVRPASQAAELFASVSNYGETERTIILSVYRDEQLFEARQLSLPPGATRSLSLPELPGQPARYAARITPTDPSERRLDALPLDDAAYAVFAPPSGGRTLLVSPGNLFLERVLGSLPGVEAFRALPQEDGSFTIPDEAFDLYILDGVSPAAVPPAANLLLINPPSNDLLPVSGVFSTTLPIQAASHPLLEFVDWRAVHIRQARQVAAPEWASVLVEAPGGPLLLAGEQGGRRVVSLTFDLHDSDLPLQVTFPILLNNLVTYLLGQQTLRVVGPGGALPGSEALNELRPGDSLLIQPPGSGAAPQVTSPGGEVHRPAMQEGGAVFSATGELGIYRVSFPAAAPGGEDYFAVNLFAPGESDIRPAQALQFGRSSVLAARGDELGQRELWPWLAALALGVLVLEWWVYHNQSVQKNKEAA